MMNEDVGLGPGVQSKDLAVAPETAQIFTGPVPYHNRYEALIAFEGQNRHEMAND